MFMWDQLNKTQPKNFIKITKTPNFPKKFENLGLKCMKDEEKKGLRPLSNRFELEKGWKLEREKDFFREKGFWI